MSSPVIAATSATTNGGAQCNDHGAGHCREPFPRPRELNLTGNRSTATIGALLWLLGSLPFGVSTARASSESPSVAQCIELVSRHFSIDPLPLHLLAEMEGGWPGAVRRNANGSEDLGPMQVNSIHLPEFAAMGISRDDIRDNRGCRNVWVAVFLYVRHLRASHGNPARAMARYHSKTPRFALQYLDRVAGLVRNRLKTNETVRNVGVVRSLPSDRATIRSRDSKP